MAHLSPRGEGSAPSSTAWVPIEDSWAFDKLAARLRALADKYPQDWADRYIAYDPQPGKPDDARRRAAADIAWRGPSQPRLGRGAWVIQRR